MNRQDMAVYTPTDDDCATNWSGEGLEDYSSVRTRLPLLEEFVVPIKPCSFYVDADLVSVQDALLLKLHIPALAIGCSILQPGYTAFILPISWDGELRINGQEAKPSSMYFPSEQEGFYLKGENRRLFGGAFNRQRFIECLAALQGVGPEDVSLQDQVIDLPGVVRKRFCEKLNGLLPAKSSGNAQGALPLNPDEISGAILDLAANVYLLSRSGGARSFAVRNPHKIVRKAEEYFMAQIKRPVSLTELCLATGVGKSSLCYAFDCIYGESPIGYFRKRRLMMVRSALFSAAPQHGAVSRVARRLGIRDMGRFSADYHRLFGDLPSATLKRSAPSGELAPQDQSLRIPSRANKASLG